MRFGAMPGHHQSEVGRLRGLFERFEMLHPARSRREATEPEGTSRFVSPAPPSLSIIHEWPGERPTPRFRNRNLDHAPLHMSRTRSSDSAPLAPPPSPAATSLESPCGELK